MPLRRPSLALILSLLLAAPAFAAESGPMIEDMTWPEVAKAIQGGSRTALLPFGSTEQNGPHMVLGKHNRVIQHLSRELALALGHTLVYPVIPAAPTGDAARGTAHMAFPGSVSLRAASFGALAEDLVASAIAAGFKRVVLLGDHGEGQDVLAAVAARLDAVHSPSGVRVIHLKEIYDSVSGVHGGREDTAMLLAIEGDAALVRRNAMTAPDGRNGADGDPRGASVEEGRRLLQQRLNAALARLRQVP